MPNWCSCALVVSTSHNIETSSVAAHFEIHQLRMELDNVIAANGHFMQHFLPMPEELISIHQGSISIDNVTYRRWTETVENNKIVRKGLTDEDCQRLVEQYGADGWYDWRLSNYGCKWDCTIEQIKIDNELIHITFDTPWSPPETFIANLSAMYPSLQFTLAYCEQGSGYWGTTTFANGRAIDMTGDDNGIYDDTTVERDDDDDYEYTLRECVAEHLDRYHLNTGG